ncbi:MAG TPA: 2-oxoglutarate dehydrogenase complex dihydrolipoyllysine-residue succinyltransferase [Candidatus Binatia bacterium]|nr:2-oxoglutarate dehydrogenase complex dihydrolipoyllysine-residue succinyltransferase [Candidatus Binatia bacterium]
MSVALKVPEVGESIREVIVGEWLKREGDPVERDEDIVVLETDKATMELPAPASGTLSQVLKKTGDTAAVGEVIGYLETGAPSRKEESPTQRTSESAAPAEREREPKRETEEDNSKLTGEKLEQPQAAAARAPGAGGVEAAGDFALDLDKPAETERQPEPQAKTPEPPRVQAVRSGEPYGTWPRDGREEVVRPMTPIRRRIAERLVAAQQTTAFLTTFNEIDMSAVNSLRQEYQEVFRQKYGIKLGLMSFFVKAAVEALRLIPQVNAEIRGTDIVYRNYFDIGVAVGGGKGLVVPVLRDAQSMTFAAIEQAIADFARRAESNQLKPEELEGGTFTISNGGIYGSLLSTPIINPPQSGILGMHAIQQRPVAREGTVVIRPMMYIALTYDHRIVDGREAVTFLRRIKECVESPARMLLGA